MKKHIALLALLAVTMGARAQQKSAADSLMNAMNANEKPVPVTIFKSSRLVLAQTTETVKKNELNFQIIHRFGDIAGSNGGGQTAFGIDRVNDVFFGFEYGVSDNFNIDLGRSTIGQLVQLEAKWAVMHQTSDNASPFAVTLVGEAGAKPYQTATFPTFSSRLSYLGQVIIARKFSSDISLQVSPTYVRDNTPFPLLPGNEQSFFAMQASARIKLTNHSGLIFDYAHPFSNFRKNTDTFEDPIGFGYEVETGGHVFTVNITNTNSVSEMNMLSNSQQRFSKGQYRIGFTISRMFDFNPKVKKEKY
ncbi:DUF5777 family beta-barrel protein [Mucilaginibacter sp. UR6-11]|uniref:DUF5777 family beta-barrel protein n=1 Tax=Mucilaginibacter sp. UR6-11 TaxID=1435644 RepID=UPI001E38A9DB|nr:DUF5777 family beta-barrel protein [Mucilaginibacter sp. UR6-11]MCC8427153.1 DUF5777 family beta-barrel protein [Mucilaginibacter sp. UR6-11]